MMEVFVEQPMALPGFAYKITITSIVAVNQNQIVTLLAELKKYQ